MGRQCWVGDSVGWVHSVGWVDSGVWVGRQCGDNTGTVLYLPVQNLISDSYTCTELHVPARNCRWLSGRWNE